MSAREKTVDGPGTDAGADGPGAPPRARDGTRPRTAFVLAGGGAKGAFEAGALRYLVEERAILPDVVTAASAGAIAGAVISQARTPEEFAERVRDLEAELLALTHSSLLFGSQPWVRALRRTPVGAMVDRVLTDWTRPARPADRAVDGRSRIPGSRRLRAARALLGTALALPRVARVVRGGRGGGSMLTLDPLAAALRGRGPEGARAVDPALLARPGLDFRVAVTALRAGRLRYVTGQGTIVEEDACTPVSGAGCGPVDVIEAVLASASVPAVFPPRPLADDDYVDGGLLRNVPVDAALRLGAQRVIAIVAVPLDLPAEQRDYSQANAVEVLVRAVGAITLADRQRADLASPLPPGASLTVIDPTVDVVGPFEIAGGLLRIDMDYGWLRAADIMTEADERTRRAASGTSDAIVTARVAAWYLEEELWASRRPPAEGWSRLLELKRQVREALRAREKLGFAGLPGDGSWWSGYERHAAAAPPWLPPAPFDPCT